MQVERTPETSVAESSDRLAIVAGAFIPVAVLLFIVGLGLLSECVA